MKNKVPTAAMLALWESENENYPFFGHGRASPSETPETTVEKKKRLLASLQNEIIQSKKQLVAAQALSGLKAALKGPTLNVLGKQSPKKISLTDMSLLTGNYGVELAGVLSSAGGQSKLKLKKSAKHKAPKQPVLTAKIGKK